MRYYVFCYYHGLPLFSTCSAGVASSPPDTAPSLRWSRCILVSTIFRMSHAPAPLSHASSDCVVAAAVAPSSPPNLVLSAASIRCVCDVVTHVGARSPRSTRTRALESHSLQAAQGSRIDSLSVTWSDGLNWEVAITSDEARNFCDALLRACAPAVRQTPKMVNDVK
jgi:hypothetical protein